MVVTRNNGSMIRSPSPFITVERVSQENMSSTSTDGKVYKKRPHRKVKSGCQTCKRRKIKCDELKPQCSNCHRYASECVYPTPADNERLRPSMSPAAYSPDSNSEEFYGGAHELPMRDLALMHQWSVATCYGFGDRFADDMDPWRDEIPIMALQFPFLMRGILALSALHLAKNTLDRCTRIRHLRTAAYHQDLAIPEYRSTLLDVTKENVVAVMAFSGILTIYSLAAPKDPDRLFAEGPPEWIFLHRGVGDIPTHWQSWLENTFVDRQTHRRRLQPVNPSLNPEDYRLHCLEALIASLPIEDANEVPAYESALYWLRQAYAHTYNPESMLGGKYALLFWIERVPQGYIDLLSLQRPCAMVLLANAAVLMKRASHFWYMEGFAEHTISEAKQMMGLEYLPWIDWPMQACGMV